MNAAIRRIAVSGSAAVALLGGAAAITIVDSPTASAATQTVAHRAATAPIRLPDGRTVRITGMGGYGHTASVEHVATVTAFKTDATPGAGPAVGTGVVPDGGGQGAPIQNPNSSTPAGAYNPAGYNPQQVTTQAGGGYIAVGATAILVLGIIVFFKVKHGHIKALDAVIVALLGISLAGTVVGTMGHQVTNSLVGSLSGVLGGL
ncbi:hypothetical protein [Streptomyces sp. CBMA152]|uniref:hypothetical protein n=1 Tax=Streptomyces sp. CBMA152 TaxID=1896312 RepID=UPI001661557D|nr:hypothetical protein [Streptomyces sp. CBMA152]MBD0743562.1 hypothetical protein [Streptomyces sp. CBMA152]